MDCLDYDWVVDKVTEWHRLWFVGDQHYGSTDCAVDHVKGNIEEIRSDDRARLVLMGDCCDFISYTDKRFDVQQVAQEFIPKLDDLPRRCSDEFVKLYEPVKDKIVCLIPGNHDEKIRLKYHFDVAGYIAAMLDVPLLSTVSQLRLRLREGVVGRNGRSFVVKGILSHAEKGSTLVGGKVTAAQRIFDFFGDHDFMAQAHTHEYLVHEGVSLDVFGRFGKPKIWERPRMLFITGGYLKTYGPGAASYGEKRGYRPAKLGSPRLEMRLKRSHHTSVRGGRQKKDKPELRGF